MYDVVISGAGPAGASAAQACAKQGLRTLLLERDDPPKEKCCAGGVLDRSIRQLGTSLPDRVLQKEIHGVRVFHGERHFDFRSEQRISVTVRRSDFDRFLVDIAEKRGAEVINGKRVSRVKMQADSVSVSCGNDEFQAKVMIIAEGATSRSASQLFGPYPLKDMSIGLISICQFENVRSDLLEFYLTDGARPRLQFEFPGCVNGWMFPHRTGGNVGVGGLKVPTPLLHKTLDEVIKAAASNNDGLVEEGKRYAHPIPVRPRKSIVKGRALLVGDAAGLASPITGEGISYAITSGKLAGDSVAAMISGGGSPSCLKSYEQELRKEAVSTLIAARMISVPLQRVIDMIDVDRFMEIFKDEERLFSTSVKMCRGEGEWKTLLKETIPRFPYLFFSSLT